MRSDGVQVWTARPDRLDAGACSQFLCVLDHEERDRARRLHCEADRVAFITAHALRRIALGVAMAVDPQELRFSTGAHGQPILLDAPAHAPRFSLSRSRGLVAVALGHGTPVGVDVEAVRDGVDGSLLEPFMALAPGELGDDIDFYSRWTALEAFWKARGLGLSTAHPRIRLQPLADECWEVLFDGGERRGAGTVVMRLPCEATHVLALACDEPVPVRMVELEGLARLAAAHPQEALSSCKDRDCDVAAAPSMFSQ